MGSGKIPTDIYVYCHSELDSESIFRVSYRNKFAITLVINWSLPNNDQLDISVCSLKIVLLAMIFPIIPHEGGGCLVKLLLKTFGFGLIYNLISKYIARSNRCQYKITPNFPI